MVREVLDEPGKFLFRARWFFFALLLLAFLEISNLFPGWMNEWYRDGFFKWLRIILDPFNRIIPFSAFWILIIASVINLIKAVNRDLVQRLSWWLNTIGLWIGMFILLWGLNHSALSYKELSGQHWKDEAVSSDELKTFLLQLSDSLNEIEWETDNFTGKSWLKDVSGLVADHLEKQNCPSPGKPKLVLAKEGMLRRLGISGIYLPYTFEAYVDASLPPAIIAFTAAHEMAHAYGYTHEAEASYIAIQAMDDSEKQEFRTAAQYALWLSASNRLERNFPEIWQSIQDPLPQRLLSEKAAIEADQEKYRSKWWAISEASNDLYLKSMGQKDGIDTYGLFLDWKIRETLSGLDE